MARRHGTHGRREPSRHSRRSSSRDRAQQPDEQGSERSQRQQRPQRRERSAGPRRPASWRDAVRPGYDYADETEDMSRRDRRRERSAQRREDHAQRMAWLREQRRSEPASPAGLVAVVVLLAIVLLGVGGGLPRLLRGDEPERPPVGLLTPADRPDDATEATQSGDSPSPTATAPSRPLPNATLPVITQRPSAQSTAAANQVTRDWASAFYTRDPAKETYPQLVARAARYTTPQVAESFKSAGDSTYEALRADGGVSQVVKAAVTAPRPGIAPVDTPTRISRLVTVSVDVTGRRPAKLTVPLLVTVVQEDGRWVISDVNGGTGP
jgi:hypothetical protein